MFTFKRIVTAIVSSVLFFVASLPFVKSAAAKSLDLSESAQNSSSLCLKHANEINVGGSNKITYSHGSHSSSHGSHSSSHGSHGSHYSGS